MSAWIGVVRERLTEEFGSTPPICVLATADAAGNPSARCMMIRTIDESGSILFISDRRTAKDEHLRHRPECEIVLWLPASRTQIRIRGRAGIVDGEVDAWMAESWWTRMSDESRGNFRGMTDHPVKPSADDEKAAHSESVMPGTFEMIVVHPETVELLDLRPTPHVKKRWDLHATPRV